RATLPREALTDLALPGRGVRRPRRRHNTGTRSNIRGRRKRIPQIPAKPVAWSNLTRIQV
ncbi:hypothetical protein CH063_06822, partial [Colletotrichum higginsianum]